MSIKSVTNNGIIPTKPLKGHPTAVSQWSVRSSDSKAIKTYYIIVIQLPGKVYGVVNKVYISDRAPDVESSDKTIFDNKGEAICSFEKDDAVIPSFNIDFDTLKTAKKTAEIWTNWQILLEMTIAPSSAAAAAAPVNSPSKTTTSVAPIKEDDQKQTDQPSLFRRAYTLPVHFVQRAITPFCTFRSLIAIAVIASVYLGWNLPSRNDLSLI